MVIAPAPMQNHLLAGLPPIEAARIIPQLGPLVPLRVGDMIYEPGGRMPHAYFPTTAVVSLHYIMESGASAETAGVGHEGVVGVSLFMGGNSTPSSAVVQIAGQGYRLESGLLKEEFHRGGVMQQRLLRYTQALIAQMTQTAVCNRHHSIEQQVCRWLLHIFDRVPQRELVVTHEQIAATLGVRRESVTEAAGRLQAAGILRNRRGHIAVLERPGLTTRVCECYAVVKAEMARLLEGGDAADDTSVAAHARPNVVAIAPHVRADAGG